MYTASITGNYGGAGPHETGYGTMQTESLANVQLSPSGRARSMYAVTREVKLLTVYGIRVTVSGLAAGKIGASLAELDEAGNVIEQHVLEPLPSGTDDLLHAYVANHTQHSLTVIQTDTNARVATIQFPAGSSPRMLDFTPDGREVYVTCQGDKTVKIIDTLTHEVSGELTFPVNAVPLAVAISPVGARAYVSTIIQDYVAAFDTDARSLIKLIPLPPGSDPASIAVSPDGKRVYCCLINRGAIAVIDAGSLTVSATVKLPAGAKPSAVAVAPDGERIYVADVHHDRIYCIHAFDHVLAATVMLDEGSDPQQVIVTPDGALGYAVCRGTDEIVAINLSRNEILTKIELPKGSNASDIAVTADGLKIYVTILTFGYVAVIEVASQLPIAILPTGSFSVRRRGLADTAPRVSESRRSGALDGPEPAALFVYSWNGIRAWRAAWNERHESHATCRSELRIARV